MTKHRNNGLRKFCKHLRREWARCGCPWHFSFRGIRLSLNKQCEKPPGYEMSKTEAEGLRDQLRADIRSGEFNKPVEPPPADIRLTVGDVADEYVKKHVHALGRRPGPVKAALNYLRIIRATPVPAGGGTTVAFEAKPIAEVTKADVEAVRDARRAVLTERAARRTAKAKGASLWRQALPGVRGGEVGIEHMMAILRHLFRWGIREGYLDATPFERHGQVVVQVRTQKKQHRRRRLDAESKEEERLLAAACPKGRTEFMAGHLRDLIVAALETGCRRGELLSLQWNQVKEQMRFIDLPADKTKTADPRLVPITAKLRAVLEYRKIGPDGKELGPDAYVFGNEVGESVGRITTAWNAACRRAGIEDLHFHDLRHEFISRLLEAGVAIHKVRDWAGHRNIATTGLYANTTLTHLEDARKTFEAYAPMDGRSTKNTESAQSDRTQ